MKLRLVPIIVTAPDPDADREMNEALDSLADALAEQLLTRTREEVLGQASPEVTPRPSRSGRAPLRASR